MTQSSKTEVLGFDKWWDDCGYKYDFKKPAARDAYVLGKESRQEEVDKLKAEIDELRGENKSLVGLVDFDTKKMEELHTAIDELQTKLKSTKRSADEVIGAMSISIYKRNKENESLNQVVEELQKRIDDALKTMEAECENSWDLWKEKADMYEQGASDAYEKSYWILKGK